MTESPCAHGIRTISKVATVVAFNTYPGIVSGVCGLAMSYFGVLRSTQYDL
jgi:hypothetical protein